ncbi:type IV pilus assembly protein PilN [Litorivivens lipolytica]|uniref:Type IV pilus assembly protein PilN n=1 Tax=Litorivivens lipolytica TaxID=1524264 RepID=A0A7W4W6K0_9GAMM|nr:PilN domain-containing protein [Litorivivens lipolytica]MBB3047772.1 type IV pilus assembly protein PilN [Litorivivens lipolytica]
MAKINLLPWREERRAALQKQFLVILVGMAVFGGLIVFLGDRYFNALIDHQNARNNYLQQHIAELNRQVAEIRELEKRRAELLERMEIIQGLQGKRPVIVRIFDETVRTMPDGAFFLDMTRTGDAIKVSGKAESNNRVSSLMRKLDNSEWFKEPNLTSVKAAPDFGEQGSQFELSFKITSPDAEAEAKEK